MKNLNKFLKPMMIVVLVFVVVSSFFDFIFQTNDLNTNKALNHLEDIGKQESNAFNQQFENLNNIVKSTSNLLGNNSSTEKEIGNILETVKKEKNYFTRLWYVDEEKILNNYKENIKFKTDNSFIDELFKGHSGITDVFTSSFNNKKIVSIYSPIYTNKKIVGGIIGVIEINKENKDFIYNDIFEDIYVLTTSVSGDIITKIKNHNTLYYGNNYFEFLKNDVHYMRGKYDEVINNIENGNSGFIQYKYNNKERIVYYSPVKINKWYSFTIANGNTITQQNDKMNKITAILIIKISIAFIIFIIFLIKHFNKINKINIQTNEKLSASNRKIDTVLKQISDRIFEYDIINDSLILDAWNDNPKIVLNHFLSNIHNYNFVCRKDEKLFKEAFKSIGIDNNKSEFDAQLPYISKDEETWYHISMIYDEKSKHAIGTLKNSTKEMKEYLELLQDNLFKNSIYSDALYMFAVNMKEKKVVIYQENGEYHKVKDTDYDEYINDFIKKYSYKKDNERLIEFFQYDEIRKIYYDKNKKNKLEYRHFNSEKNEYCWVKCRVHFERQSSNNELLMIVYCSDIDNEKKKQMEIEFMATRDGLTHLYNRQTFNKKVDNYLINKYNSSNYCAFMILDLDNFKVINDNLGHSVGDKVLKDVAKILENVFENNGYVARFGGDEYVVFIYNQESYSIIEQKAADAIQLIHQIYINDNYSITASLGIRFVNDEKNHQELFDKADKSLYDVKKSGKNKFNVYIEK